MAQMTPSSFCVINKFAYVNLSKRDYAAAEPVFKHVMEGRTAKYGEDHPKICLDRPQRPGLYVP